MKKVGIVMGSDSDLPVVQKAMDTLDALGVPFEAHICSAHRTPDAARDFARTARERGFGAIIAAAGMAAHLAGAIAANTTLRFRCPAGCRWQLWPSTEVSMPLCFAPRFWPWETRTSRKSWMTAAPGRLKRSWKRTALSRTSWPPAKGGAPILLLHS